MIVGLGVDDLHKKRKFKLNTLYASCTPLPVLKSHFLFFPLILFLTSHMQIKMGSGRPDPPWKIHISLN